MKTNCKTNRLWFFLILLCFFSHQSLLAQHEAKSAILLVDIQEDFTGENAKMPVNAKQASNMINNLNTLIKSFNEQNVLIVYIGNEFSKNSIYNAFRNYAAIEGSEGIAIDKRLLVVNDNYFAKSKGDAFSNPELNFFLKKQGISDVYVSGLYAEGCVSATIKGALNSGYSTYVLSDCVASKSDKKKAKSIEKFEKKGFVCTTSQQLIEEVQFIN